MSESQEAVYHIVNSCKTIGAFFGTGEVNGLLLRVADDMKAAIPTTLFPDRHKEHVAYALTMVANNTFTDPQSAIASVYLATRFEFYFRILSGKLNADGTWISPQLQNVAKAAINDSRLASNRVSSVGLTYKIMKLDQSKSAAQVFDQLDNVLYPTSQVAGTANAIADIGDRIEFLRHPAGHGVLGDISSESNFYGLATAIVYFNQA